MYIGKTLFAQVMEFLPWKTFHRIVDRYGGDHWTRSLNCAAQFRVMAFAQLTYRESLRLHLLQVFSVTVFEKMPIQSVMLAIPDGSAEVIDSNQLNLFTF
jgi:hypothetical protein